MREETAEQPAPLRSGLTTGSCATATSLAAARLLLGGQMSDAVEIVLPKGKQVQMRLEFCRLVDNFAEAGTLKDAGDDPDVTHGALVFARVRLEAAPGVRFVAGAGVGSVTRPGLVLAVGEPAINPVPRRMMTEHLLRLTEELGYSGGFEVTIGVEGGEALALKTMNPRSAFSADCRFWAPAGSSGRFPARPTSPRSIKVSTSPPPTATGISPPAPAMPAKTPCVASTTFRISP